MKYVSSFFVLLVMTLMSSRGFAQNSTPSSKATAAINTTVGCVVQSTTTIDTTLPVSCRDLFSGVALDVTADHYVTVMSSTMKVSNSQSIFVSPSLVTGLYTRTLVQTKPRTTDNSGTSTAVAEGAVYLRAIVTNLSTGEVELGYPAAVCNDAILGCHAVGGSATAFGVALDTRVQSLTQSLSQCIVNDLTGVQIGTCDFTLTTDLLLQTTSAHTYNFIFPNVGVGVYKIDIQAAVDATATVSGSGTAVAGAAYGLGSLTVESVRLVHDFTF